MPEARARAAHVAAVVAAVVRQAVRDAGAAGVLVREPGSHEGRLVREWCEDVVPAGEHEHALLRGEREDALTAHPANKTALLLGGRIPPEPLLPVGDLYASQIEALAGGWTAPAVVRELAERAGGIAALDGALAALVDERRAAGPALATLPPAVRPAVLAAFEQGRFARRRVGIVPKLGARTLGIDLFA